MEGGIQGEIEKLRWRERNGDTDLEKRREAAKEMKETEIQGSGRGQQRQERGRARETDAIEQ